MGLVGLTMIRMYGPNTSLSYWDINGATWDYLVLQGTILLEHETHATKSTSTKSNRRGNMSWYFLIIIFPLYDIYIIEDEGEEKKRVNVGYGATFRLPDAASLASPSPSASP